MNFISIEFLLFFFIVLVIWYSLPDKNKGIWLLFANVVFVYLNGG